MTVPELNSKYMRETHKHPIDMDLKKGSYSDDYVIWLHSLIANKTDLEPALDPVDKSASKHSDKPAEKANCSICKDEFEKEKSFHNLCDECSKHW